MPIFTARTSKSSRTALICASTTSGRTSWTALTVTVFWAVTAVSTEVP